MNIIQTENLTKKFDEIIAVDNMSLNVRDGEIYGFLGLNGAGKTTTIRLLLGMIKPDSGSISIFGKHIKQASSFWNLVGYMVETPKAYPNLSVKENLEVFCHLRGLFDKNMISEIIDILQLNQYENKKAKYLSLGNSQRLGLAKALLHKPQMLILDEPINGLDPAGIIEIREYLKSLVKNHNMTIFLSSHILSEISKVATRIGIVHKGRLIKEISSSELEQQIIKKLYINTNDNSKALIVIKNHGYNAKINLDNIIEMNDLNTIQQPDIISTLLVNSGIPPKMINVFEEDLENYFLRIIST
jgi:ABC-2 type transport system ATP-binding protein